MRLRDQPDLFASRDDFRRAAARAADRYLEPSLFSLLT
jgi:hypothetical protein